MASPSSEQQQAAAGKDCLTFAMANMTGSVVKVQLTSGPVYEGVLHGCDIGPDGHAGVALRMAYKLDVADPTKPFGQGPTQPSHAVVPKLYIPGADVAQIGARGIDLGFRAPPPKSGGSRGGSRDTFTDTGISGGYAGGTARELQPWQDDGDADLLGGLEEMDSGPSTSGWSPQDMFLINEQQHGIKSTFDESEYTTTINTSNPDYERRMREAERIAREMEGKSRSRYQASPNATEEELHSSVSRYVPPHQKGGAPKGGKRTAKNNNNSNSGSGKASGKPAPAAGAAPSNGSRQGSRKKEVAALREFSSTYDNSVNPGNSSSSARKAPATKAAAGGGGPAKPAGGAAAAPAEPTPEDDKTETKKHSFNPDAVEFKLGPSKFALVPKQVQPPQPLQPQPLQQPPLQQPMHPTAMMMPPGSPGAGMAMPVPVHPQQMYPQMVQFGPGMRPVPTHVPYPYHTQAVPPQFIQQAQAQAHAQAQQAQAHAQAQAQAQPPHVLHNVVVPRQIFFQQPPPQQQHHHHQQQQHHRQQQQPPPQ